MALKPAPVVDFSAVWLTCVSLSHNSILELLSRGSQVRSLPGAPTVSTLVQMDPLSALGIWASRLKQRRWVHPGYRKATRTGACSGNNPAQGATECHTRLRFAGRKKEWSCAARRQRYRRRPTTGTPAFHRTPATATSTEKHFYPISKQNPTRSSRLQDNTS